MTEDCGEHIVVCADAEHAGEDEEVAAWRDKSVDVIFAGVNRVRSEEVTDLLSASMIRIFQSTSAIPLTGTNLSIILFTLWNRGSLSLRIRFPSL